MIIFRFSESRAPMVFGMSKVWLTSWAMGLPVVVLAAPRIQRIALSLIRGSNKDG